MTMEVTLLLAILIVNCLSQRPPYLGSVDHFHYGYPDIDTTTTVAPSSVAPSADQSGQKQPSVTPRPLPVLANGDMQLIKRLEKLPKEHQPYWFLNWKALEEEMHNPQTYPQEPNRFVNESANAPQFE